MISASTSRPLRSSPLASASSSPAATSPVSSVSSTASTSPAVSVNRSTMSITQTYYLAHRARSKLGAEASRSDHNLRVLVGHANLLDTLMLELADAERAQESWYNGPVQPAPAKTASADSAPARHIQWADQYASQPDYDSDSSSDDWDVSSTEDEDESDFDDDFDDHITETCSALRRVPAHSSAPPLSPSVVTISAVDSDSDSDADLDDDEEDLSQLSLVRTPSHSGSASGSPPDLALDLDYDSSSDDEADMPPSPPAATIDIYRSSSKSSGKESLFLTVPPRSPSRLVTNVSVY
ncbi:uncharacterized protein BROUX77_002797 [Berkeleyomyces rouxiae]|uniref:uncharacterized protein n=1 Tax=Berkeleyomyces rouxiae TaxID=2035830 RepID=UPI003B7FC973